MSTQDALVSTAMLASIWEKEEKDLIELILPFISYSIGKTTSLNNKVDIGSVSTYVSNHFGFLDIPHSVLNKTFLRLTKQKILIRESKKFFLKADLSDSCVKIDYQLEQTSNQTERVIQALNTYLNNKKDRFFDKINEEKTSNYFTDFLKKNGFFFCKDISYLRSNPSNNIDYHISQFILAEYEKKSKLFTYIENITNGFLISQVIYGYSDLDYKQRFRDVNIYLDTSLLLRVIGFKSREENIAANQLMEILRNNSVQIKCLSHNYNEVYKIIDAYKYRISNPRGSYGQSLEFFDEKGYSVSDIEVVLSGLEGYFQKSGIEIVNAPSFSQDDTGVIKEEDFGNAIGEGELKQHLKKSISYRSDEPLNNDVDSISAMYNLRKGKKINQIEKCKALFVTTNHALVYATQKYLNNEEAFVPLLITDIELTTIMWLKSKKKSSNLPTLKLIESARISMEPTEQIRTEFFKKIDKFKMLPDFSDEQADAFSLLIYSNKEKIMDLIDGDPGKIDNLQVADLEEISRQHYTPQLESEIHTLKSELEAERKKNEDRSSKEKIRFERIEATSKNAGKRLARNLKMGVNLFFASIIIMGVIGSVLQLLREDRIDIFSVMVTLFGVLGIVDSIIPKRGKLDKYITIMANKREKKVRDRENRIHGG